MTAPTSGVPEMSRALPMPLLVLAHVSLDGLELFFSRVHLHGEPAPVRRFLPELIRLIWDRKIDPGAVFDLTVPLEDAAEGFNAMDERRATKVLLTH